MKFQKTEVKILSEINVKLKNGENEKTFSSLEEFENKIKRKLKKKMFKKFPLFQMKIMKLEMILKYLI